MGCMTEMGGTRTVEDWIECAQTHTDRQTKVKTVYPPVSLRSLSEYNNKSRSNLGRAATNENKVDRTVSSDWLQPRQTGSLYGALTGSQFG